MIKREELTVQEKKELLDKGDSVKKIFKEQKLIPGKKSVIDFDGLGKNLIEKNIKEIAKSQKATTVLPEIMEIEMNLLPGKRLELPKRKINPKLPRQKVDVPKIPSLLLLGDTIIKQSTQNFNIGMKFELPEISDLPQDEKKLSMPPIEDLSFGSDAENSMRMGAGTNKVKAIDSMLDIKFFVYPTKNPAEGFFRIDISTNANADKMDSIGKDILFLVDSSNSISVSKLRTFREGLLKSIPLWNPQDRFNIATFKTKPYLCFDNYKRVTKKNKEDAIDFIESIHRSGKTNVYAGLAPFLVKPRLKTKRPLMIYLLTDGISTTSKSVSNNEFLQNLLAKNKGDISISCFSSGKDINRFLLEMIAYKNRGRSVHTNQLHQCTPAIKAMVSSTSDIVLSKLEFQIVGIPKKNVYPKKLPHIFRNEIFSVYGKYPEDTEVIVIRITGFDKNGNKKEFIFQSKIKNATKTGTKIAKMWASHKIFYLISEKSVNPTQEIYQKIRSLSDLYGIFVPDYMMK
ncbi:MAG: VWA domain-containing protein [Verrucomicrobiota bacterium]|nr:VWA domain-containing protein [Verrucomicrobiota bacterium]